MNTKILVFLAAVVAMSQAPAVDFPLAPFSHKDWEIACEADEAERNALILLTRKVGPAEPFHVQLRLAENGDDLPNQVQMRIDCRALGPVKIDNSALGALSPVQTAELLAALPKNAQLSRTTKSATWPMSNQGVNAVLLKMDEFRGRLGSAGALIRKGTKPESSVLPPLPAPKMTPVRVPSDP